MIGVHGLMERVPWHLLNLTGVWLGDQADENLASLSSQSRRPSPQLATASQGSPDSQSASCPAEPEHSSTIPSHQGISHDGNKISRQQPIWPDDSSIEEDDTWGVVDPSEPWVDDDYHCRPQPQTAQPPPTARRRHSSPSQRQESVCRDHDDASTVFIESDDSEIQWEGNNQSVDYIIPFDGTIRHETYPFERDYPNAAPLLRYIFSLPQAQRGAIMVRAIRGCATTTLGDVARHLDQAVMVGRVVINGSVVRAQDLATLLQERWTDWSPDLLEEMWDTVATLDGRTTVRRGERRR